MYDKSMHRNSVSFAGLATSQAEKEQSSSFHMFSFQGSFVMEPNEAGGIRFLSRKNDKKVFQRGYTTETFFHTERALF